MADILIRDVSDQVVAALDAHAARLGISRSEYVRRQWIQDAARSTGPVAVADFDIFTDAFQDLADPEIMTKAWE